MGAPSPNGAGGLENSLYAPLASKELASASIKSIGHPFVKTIGHPLVLKVAGNYLF